MGAILGFCSIRDTLSQKGSTHQEFPCGRGQLSLLLLKDIDLGDPGRIFEGYGLCRRCILFQELRAVVTVGWGIVALILLRDQSLDRVTTRAEHSRADVLV